MTEVGKFLRNEALKTLAYNAVTWGSSALVGLGVSHDHGALAGVGAGAGTWAAENFLTHAYWPGGDLDVLPPTNFRFIFRTIPDAARMAVRESRHAHGPSTRTRK